MIFISRLLFVQLLVCTSTVFVLALEKIPHVFKEQDFITEIEAPHGRIRHLPKFTDISEHLKGIENYRISIMEIEPHTFVLPQHWDAEAVLFVVQGKGTISLVDEGESFDIKTGDIIRVPVGFSFTTYFINRDNIQNLITAKILESVSCPGCYNSFFGSFLQAFSDEIIDAGFNSKKGRIQRIFNKQNQGSIFVKASEEQIKALSHPEENGVWALWEGLKGAVNIFKRWPLQENEYGKLYRVDLAEYRRLQDVDIAISFMNISQGGMSAPMYNSRAISKVK